MVIDPRIDPALGPLLDRLKPFGFSNDNLDQIRADADSMLATEAPDSASTTTEYWTAPSTTGPTVRMLCHRPSDDDILPVFFHIHGGGFVLGKPEMSAARNGMIAERCNCAVFSVDYRLAPEAKFPEPLEDCYSALKWIIDNSSCLRIDPSRVVVGGESAGGGLAAALAILVRDRGEFAINGQMLTYPMLDDRSANIKGDAKLFHVWTVEDNRFGWHAMLGHEPGTINNLSPYAAPARLLDFDGLAPAFIAVGAIDLFLRENVEYALKLADADVSVEMVVYPGAFHGFILSSTASVGRQYQRAFISALKRFLT